MTPAVGQRIDDAGRYELGERIGRGATGEVYQARDRVLARDVAIKVLSADLAGDPRRLARLRREGQVLAGLNHPQIATLHDVATIDGRPALVMELVEGETLHDRIRVAGRLGMEEAMGLAVQIAAALEAAHARGVVHCDLKPANIKLRPDGQIKVLDFGLALLGEPPGVEDLEAASTQSSTSAPRLHGTPAYLSPERVAGEPPDARDDVWALGCVLYEMLTGRRAFGRDSLGETLRAIADPRPDLSALPSAPAVRTLLRRHLHPDRRARLATMHEARVLLEDSRGAMREVSQGPRRWLRSAAAAAATLGVFVVSVAWLWFAPTSRPAGEGATPRVRTLAVLPLRELSGQRDQAYFAEGMTDALTAELSKVGGLRVVSYQSARLYHGTTKPIAQIVTELGVDAVVTGSLLREADRVRVTVQLVDARTDRQLWAENYVREMRSVLVLQAEVARAIADAIEVRLTPDERARLTPSRFVDQQAYDLYLRGRHHWAQLTPEGMQQAIEQYEASLRRDPRFAPAFAGLAGVYSLGINRLALRPRELLARAEAAVSQALALDDSSAEAHAALGWIQSWCRWEFGEAERSYRRALERNPSFSLAHSYFAGLLVLKGEMNAARSEAAVARQLDPLSTFPLVVQGAVEFWSRDFDRAIQVYRETLAIAPRFSLAHYNLGMCAEQQGRYDEAIAAYRTAIALGGEQTHFLAFLARSFALSGNVTEARTLLSRLRERSATSYVSPSALARVHLSLQERDQAISQLELAYEERDPFLTNVKREWFYFTELRGDPRFEALVQRMNFPGGYPPP